MSNRSIFRVYPVWLIIPFQDNFIRNVSIFLAKFRRVDNAIGTMSRFNYYIYFKILPQQHFKELFSKLTHSPKSQNDVLHDKILIWMLPLQVYIEVYVCIVRPNWAIHAVWKVFLKSRNNCDANWETNWVSVQFQ